MVKNPTPDQKPGKKLGFSENLTLFTKTPVTFEN